MDKSENSKASVINQKVFNAVSVVLVTLMMTCISITVTLFGQSVMPGWQASYLPALCTLVALERLTTFKQVKRLTMLSKQWIIFHVTQWVVILIVLKAVLLIAQRPASLWVEIQLWRLDFLTSFFDPGYLSNIVFTVVVWLISGYFASLLDEMSLEESLIKYELATVAPMASTPVRERLLGTIFGLGFIQVILTALMRINLRMIFKGAGSIQDVEPLPYLAAGAWNVLLYFLLGLALMSLSQFARLNARWHFQGIKITPQLASKWAVNSIIFIFLIALVASLLPTNYSLGLLSVISYILQVVFGFVFFVFAFFWESFLYLLNLLSKLLGVTLRADDSLPPLSYSPPQPPVENLSTGTYPWLEIIKSLVFWVVFIGIVGFSIYQFTRQHEGILGILHRIPGMTWLKQLLRFLIGRFKGFNKRIAGVFDSGLQRLRDRRRERGTGTIGRFINIRKLNPRQRVYFYYLAMIRRGGEKGLPRKTAQTPYEYAVVLEEAIPEVDEEVDSLTEVFIQARYSQKNLDEGRVSPVKHYWERIRGALRSFRR